MREFLSETIPEYMIPSQFVPLDALPLTTNGKIDRQQLPKPEIYQGAERALVAEPRNPLEEILLEIWRELLGISTISIYDNFFSIGGHSLLVTQLIARVRAVLQVEISLRSFFETPTLAEFAQGIEQALRGQHQLQAPPLLPTPRTQTLPLSFAQQRLWFLYQLEPESTAYLLARIRRFQGVLDVRAFERSLWAMVQRHEILRTTFEVSTEQPEQVIHEDATVSLPIIDLRGLTSEVCQEVARGLATQEAHIPCDLERGPLMRTALLRLDEQDHVLFLTMHHIISDGWSNDIFERELTALYRAFSAGQASPLPALAIQYADYAYWQRQWLDDESLGTHLAYWKRQLADVPPLDLPLDRPRPPVQTFNGAFMTRHLSKDLLHELTALSQRENVTFYMLLLAAFQVLLARYANQIDISVGTPIANRTHAEVEGLIGFFVNMLVMRTDLAGDPTFSEVLGRVREVALGAYTHQDMPFERLVEELQPERHLSRPPLFQVMFMAQQLGERLELADNLAAHNLSVGHTITKFDLTLSVTSSVHGLACSVEYNTDLFNAQTIERFLLHWQTLLEGVVATPHDKISALPFISAPERQLVLREWNATQRAYPSEKCVQRLFEECVDAQPDTIALVYEEEQLTYRELNARANQLAHYLRRVTVGPEIKVGLCLERSLDLLISTLAILKAGECMCHLIPRCHESGCCCC
ncbi:hypothetical protein KSB_85970 [Ktedonobacter robiniae]|uniref:Carrier domain-containing protein n=1 Tax=Ktedonobacter robiniae TaxID=2778365 RepID=A0ABQ3V5T9_9CHLR|nr:hypothetical protein KSB_85970 [Ktedonobacter robiniae]